ncbi:tRNA lysidine(34) synthetase TilS [Candidatus Steffania adelgidicola]|uniref:tRNA lysidine(34) synthetase TilS n=1 Tax=Candidatus Steffania adelgidicola TaxID=1076626 RepID=UPI001D01534C|nr:tRNA lysidine(34) synthetase TilS [Candidatus Steffania adelgidicola]UDG79620.1 tRNA(Ile)-lysidine synthase [Candidatus Steffania adelgidicola]
MKAKDTKLVQTLNQCVAAHVVPYSSVLLAFSGGLDSTVLLDALATISNSNHEKNVKNALPLRAMHINHGLNGKAEQWVAHCAHECHVRTIPFITENVVLNTRSQGIEAAARSARYFSLAAALKKDEVLLTAQHQDDQAETLLLALKRGSGPTGLAAMASDTPFGKHRLVRPLLTYSRLELETYARERGLCWIEDDSNTDIRFDRNFLRLQILPLLLDRWPRFSASVTRSARLCAEQERLLDELLSATLNKLTNPDGSLCWLPLTTMSQIKRAALLRRWLASYAVKMPSQQQLTHLWEQVALSRQDAIAKMKLENQQIRRFRDRLYIVPCSPALHDKNTVFLWPAEKDHLILPSGLGIVRRCQIDIASLAKKKLLIASITGNNIPQDEINGTRVMPRTIVRAPLPEEEVSIRFGSVQGLVYITTRQRGRKLKKIWQELGIPPWRRSSTALLFYHDHLIAALGVFVTKEGAAREPYEQWHVFLEPDKYH